MNRARAAWGCVIALLPARLLLAAGFGAAQLDALITDPALDEISGLATSRRIDDRYWVHNDAPRPAQIIALDGKGQRHGSVIIAGVRAVDWEDIASYSLNGKPWLLIGDIGDNAGARDHVELIAIDEPALADDGSEVTVKPAWRLRFTYPDGAHDAEAFAVDVASRQILVLTKRSPRPLLFSLPLGPGDGSTVVATRLAELDSIPSPTPEQRAAHFPAARFGGSPTAMDIDADGRTAVVLTYRDLWVFTRAPSQSWAQAFLGIPQRIALPLLAQAEAVGFDRSGDAVRISGERLPAPWIHLQKETGGH